MQSLPFISVIVPTYNESILISEKIQNTLSVNYPKNKIEVIVIDSASTDGTASIAGKFEDVKVIVQLERKGKSSALAEAFTCVEGEIIVITDADAMLDKDALLITVQYLSDKKVGAVTGKQVLITPSGTQFEEKERSYRDIFDFIRNAESNMHSTMIFNGPLMAFKREILEAPAPNSVADDTEMAILVIKKGYRTLYAPEAIFYENIPLSDKSRLKQKQRRAQGLVQSFWKHKDMLFNSKYGLFGKEIFPAEFAVHIILPFALLISGITVSTGLYVNFWNSLLITIAFLLINAAYAAFVYSHVGSFMGTNKDEGAENKIIQKIGVTTISFLQLQYALLMGSLKLLLFGSHFKWEQIADARYQKDINAADYKKVQK
jgi:cellulose synthase/poly-beta-1,6-N-acetylglucosamine synthase-like glycosyltransferase